jgi:hypothetical protein
MEAEAKDYNARISWLYGLFRIRMHEGKPVTKLFWFTIGSKRKIKAAKRIKKRAIKRAKRHQAKQKQPLVRPIEAPIVIKRTRKKDKKTKEDKEGIFDRIKKWLKSILSIINHPSRKTVFTDVLKFLKSIKKAIIFKKFKVNVTFGTGDPAQTAKLLGYAQAIAVNFGLLLPLTPDFDRTVLEGSIHVKGKVKTLKVLLAVYRLYKRNKSIIANTFNEV